MTEKRTVFVVSKDPMGMKWKPRDLETYIDEREVIKETPKGLRLSISYADNGTMFLHDRYRFFDTRMQAMFYLESEAKAVLAKLEERAAEYVQFLQTLEDAVMKEPA